MNAAALLLIASIATATATAHAAPTKIEAVPAQCAVPDGTAFVDGPLPRLARRLRANEPLTVVVLGSGSAAGSGTSSKGASFPDRLQARLADAYPKHKVSVVTFAQPGQTAQAMAKRLTSDVLPLKPALVVLQTGSADAARSVPVSEFGMSVERSVTQLRGKGSDVLLIDSQFSPRASLLVNTEEYRDAVRLNARRYELPLFKRYDTMQFWWSNEVFDLDAERKASQVENADLIHDCVAVLLVRLVERGVAAAKP